MSMQSGRTRNSKMTLNYFYFICLLSFLALVHFPSKFLTWIIWINIQHQWRKVPRALVHVIVTGLSAHYLLIIRHPHTPVATVYIYLFLSSPFLLALFCWRHDCSLDLQLCSACQSWQILRLNYDLTSGSINIHVTQQSSLQLLLTILPKKRK